MSTSYPIKAAHRVTALFQQLLSAMPIAPWRTLFAQDVSELAMPTCVFTTLHSRSLDVNPPCPTQSSLDSFTPRARTVVFRGMWASLPDNDKNPAPRNKPTYDSDLLTFTTDTRMEKVSELFSSGDLPGTDHPPGLRGSGGGGPVETVFYMPKPTRQWRIRGKAYVLGPDIETESAGPIKAAVERRMRAIGEAGDGDEDDNWSWTREITAHFGNMSPQMRGSFRNPPQGTPITQIPDDPRLGLGQEVTDLEDEVARAHFRVVVIVPDEVDQVDLSASRRWIHRYVKKETKSGDIESGHWETCEVWP